MINKALSAGIVSLFLITGCSGGEEVIGTGVEGLKMPNKIDIFYPEPTTITQTLDENLRTNAFDDAGTDYSNHESRTYKEDDLQRHVESPNTILCILDKLRLDKTVNHGPYKALINKSLCRPDDSEQSYPELDYLLVTAVSERENNESAQFFKVWMSYIGPNPENQPNYAPEEILHGQIFDEVDSDKPYGEFALSSKFVMFDRQNNQTDPEEIVLHQQTSVSGVDETDGIFFKSITNSGLTQSVNVFLNSADSKQGEVLLKSTNTSLPENHYFDSAQFDETNILLQTQSLSGPEVLHTRKTCRLREHFVEDVSSYMLFHELDGVFRDTSVTAGQKLNLVKHLYVLYQDNDTEIVASINNTHYLPFNGELIPDGATVTNRSTLSDESYQFYLSPGILMKTVSHELPLSELNNQILHYQGAHPDPDINYNQWLVRVIDNEFFIEGMLTNFDFSYDVATHIDHDDNPATPDKPIAVQLMLADGSTTRFRDFTLGESGYSYLSLSGVPASERVIRRIEPQAVTRPSDSIFSNGPVTLYCYHYCPKGGITQEAVNNAASLNDLVYHPSFSETPVTYSISSQNHETILTDLSNNQVVDLSGLQGTETLPGLHLGSGSLLTQPLSQPVTHEKLFNQTDFVNWATSNSYYAHLPILIDANGNEVHFEEEIQFVYIHDAVNDRNNTDPLTNIYHGNIFKFNGNSIFGFKEEYGFPRKAVSLLDGTRLSNNEGDFLVKASVITQSQKPVPLQQCSRFTKDMFSEEKLSQLFTTDHFIPVSLTHSDKPDVAGEPIIVDGIFQ